ncbi:MAG TPA: ribose 5-phosphate isomerase B [Candidatus Acidoferrales bacterium]|nr:ribose 5-phosphate isomerase B [Candidatus Acidoferrales bacterium]
MKLALGADHAGWRYKDQIAEILRKGGHEVQDFGTHGDVAVDYPEYGYAVGLAVASGRAERGIVVCGSSIGISIAANKVPGVRCALVTEPYGCELARRHNDANVIALSERLMGWEMIERLLEVFLTTAFESGGRHSHRVAELEFTPAEKAKAEKALASGAVTGAETPKELLGK